MSTTLNLGNLVVTIKGDTKDVEAAEKKVRRSLKDIEKDGQDTEKAISRALTQMGARFLSFAAVVGTVRHAVVQFQNAMKDLGEMDRLSQATGIAIERLSSLRQVAQLNGVQWEQFQQVITQFSARLREFSQNDISAGAQAFRVLGIRMRDAQGNLRSLDSLLPQLADAFAKYGDGANKAAIATALFGEEGGPQMTRFLNQGSEAIRRQRLELEQSGRVVTREGVQKAREYERVMAQLNAAVDELSRDFAMMLAPSITTAARAINDFFASLRPTSVEQLNSRLAELQEREKKLSADLADPGWWGAWARNSGAQQELENVRKEIDAITERMAALRGGFTTTVTVESRQAPALPNAAALERFNELKALGKTLTREMLTAQEALTKAERDYAAALAQGSISRETYNRAVRNASVAYIENQNSLAEALGVTFTAQEKMLQQQARIEEAFRRGGISAEMYARAMQNASVTSAANMTALAQQVSSTLTTVFGKSKAAAIASGIINTAVGVTQALRTYPPPLSFAMASLQAAAGAAQIAAIRSTTESGGSAAPAPSSAPPVAAAAPVNNSTLYVEGINPGQMFTGAQMRELASSMIDFQKQGGKIVLRQT